jgi:tungstate transport system substrate-binding protein
MMYRHNAMKKILRPITQITFTLFALLLAACQAQPEQVLRLATTTSTYDSGLLQAILPDFETEYGVRVDVIAVGTGQAIAMGERGDADVLMVHDRVKEEAFVAAGHGLARYPLMYNDFVIVGPADDPAGIRGMGLANEAMARIASSRATFASRGDDSGTHAREMTLWLASGILPDPSSGWYLSIGQGMGETLQFASERRAYTLTDRGTYLAMQTNLIDLVVLVGGESLAHNPDSSLINLYSVIPVNPARHPQIPGEVSIQFVEWILSLDTQEQISTFGVDQYGQPLFFPDSDHWRSAHP